MYVILKKKIWKKFILTFNFKAVKILTCIKNGTIWVKGKKKGRQILNHSYYKSPKIHGKTPKINGMQQFYRYISYYKWNERKQFLSLLKHNLTLQLSHETCDLPLHWGYLHLWWSFCHSGKWRTLSDLISWTGISGKDISFFYLIVSVMHQ